jgi:hypothetical protein
MKTVEKSENVKQAEKVLKEFKEPKIIRKLELGSGEIYLGELTNKEKFQVLIRHIKVLEDYIQLAAQCASINSICLQELAKKQGIDINKIINSK